MYLPVLIPAFYQLSTAGCGDDRLFLARDQDGKRCFRSRSGDSENESITANTKDEEATIEDSDEEKRRQLIERLAAAVDDAMSNQHVSLRLHIVHVETGTPRTSASGEKTCQSVPFDLVPATWAHR